MSSVTLAVEVLKAPSQCDRGRIDTLRLDYNVNFLTFVVFKTEIILNSPSLEWLYSCHHRECGDDPFEIARHSCRWWGFSGI